MSRQIAAQGYRTARRRIVAGQQFDERRFAGAIFADDGVRLAAFKACAHAGKRSLSVFAY